MKVFMTGATGFIGTAVASALVNTGHEVTALVRPTSRHGALASAGIRTVDGTLESLRALGPLIGEHDAFIHAAVAGGPGKVELDRLAIDTFRGAGADGKTFIYTSGVWVLGNTGDEIVDETSATNPIPYVRWRAEHERIVIEAANDGFVTAVIRPGCVYGGSQSLFADWFAAADAGAPLEIIEEGSNRWAMVHLDDVADCYLRVLESRAGGTFHAIDDSGSTIVEVARAIAESRGKGSTIRMVSLADSRAAMGDYADALALDQRVSSRLTRERLDWLPACESFIGTIERQWAEWRQASSIAD